jgi:CDP-diacylglycerol--serine O-phosphatidyltransferase
MPDHSYNEEEEIIEIPVDEPDEEGAGGARRKRRLRILKNTAVLPSLFTLLNGMCGLGAIHFATKAALGNTPVGHIETASILIFFSMLFDMLDGRVARMARVTSDFGAQLDSLCDVISFGVAPAVLVLRCSVTILRSFPAELPAEYVSIERAFWCISGIYVACAILRLARFNVESDEAEESHMTFRGLPSPGAAACMATMALLYTYLTGLAGESSWLSIETVRWAMAIALPALLLINAVLMVSRLEYSHIANQYIRGRRPFSYLVKIVIILFSAIILPPYCLLAAMTLIYTLSGPIVAVFRLMRRKPSTNIGK